jgi:hypothetical protein
MSKEDHPEVQAMELLVQLKAGKSVYEMFQANFRTQYLIAGKSIYEWEKEFKLHIPEESTPQDCKALDIKLLDLHQRAMFHKASAGAILQALKRGVDTQLNSTKTALVTQYKSSNMKLPAATTLESMAKDQMNDVDGAVMSANVAVDFWEDIISHLGFCRKLLENITINNGIEGKASKGYV